MAAPKKLDKDEIRRMYEAEIPIVKIAKRLDVNPSTIDHHIDHMGIRRPRTPKGGGA
jgi:uncharacterized protein YjcR